jgi:hypothetical protein
MCQDNPYKSSQYRNLVVIFVDILITVNWQEKFDDEKIKL